MATNRSYGERSRSPSRAVCSRSSELRTLGSTDLKCTCLGLGGAPLGDLFVSIPDVQALETVHCAVDHGLNYFDTAPWYGIGLSEQRMGFALRRHPRDGYLLSTKVGRTLTPCTDPAKWNSHGWAGALPFDITFDYSYESIMRQHQDSLQRMGHGRVDALVIHDMEEAETKFPSIPHRARLSCGGGMRALEELRETKAIHAFGAGLNSAEGRPEKAYREWNKNYVDFLINAKVGTKHLDFFLAAGIHTLLNHSAFEDGILDQCQKLGISLVVGGAFNSGILATGSAKGATYDYEPASDEILDRARALEAVCDEHKVQLAAAALQYPLGHPAVTTVIAGAKNREEVVQAKKWMDVHIPRSFWDQLLDDALLPKNAPVPK